MPKLTASTRFKKARLKHPIDVQERIDDAIRTFMRNPRDPSLHFEKLTGSVYRTIRVNRGDYRIVLRGDGGEFTLVDVGSHDYVDKRFG